MPHIVYMYESCLYNVLSEINIKSKKKKKKKKKKHWGYQRYKLFVSIKCIAVKLE